MNTLTNPDETYSLDPETLEIADTYLSCLDIKQTAEVLGIEKSLVEETLAKREVKRFIDNVFLEQGYMNKFRLAGLLDKVVASKLEEAEETGIYTQKDLLEVLALIHKIQTDNAKIAKEATPANQTNTQINNYGGNLGSLIEKIVQGE